MAIKLLFDERLFEKMNREKRRISLSEISRETGISKNALSNLSRGVSRSNFSTLNALCRYFDCITGDLLFYIPGDQEGTYG